MAAPNTLSPATKQMQDHYYSKNNFQQDFLIGGDEMGAPEGIVNRVTNYVASYGPIIQEKIQQLKSQAGAAWTATYAWFQTNVLDKLPNLPEGKKGLAIYLGMTILIGGAFSTWAYYKFKALAGKDAADACLAKSGKKLDPSEGSPPIDNMEEFEEEAGRVGAEIHRLTPTKGHKARKGRKSMKKSKKSRSTRRR